MQIKNTVKIVIKIENTKEETMIMFMHYHLFRAELCLPDSYAEVQTPRTSGRGCLEKESRGD